VKELKRSIGTSALRVLMKHRLAVLNSSRMKLALLATAKVESVLVHTRFEMDVE